MSNSSKEEKTEDTRYVYLLKIKGKHDTFGNKIKTEYVVKANNLSEAIAYAKVQAKQEGIFYTDVTFFFKTTQAAYRDGILIHDAADGTVQENTIHRDFERKEHKTKEEAERSKKVKEWMEAMLQDM